MSCLTDPASCLVEKLFEFFIDLLLSPVRHLLKVIINLMTEPVNIGLFSEVWAIIIYMISLFYGILLLYSGFKFMVSGYSAEMRESAKSSLTNILIMIVLVQASYFLYEITLEIVASMTAVITNLTPDYLLLITMGGITNMALQFVLIIPYMTVLVLTLLILVIRYLIVGIGVLLLPIGIFFYLIEPLQAYGRLIINYLGVLIALPFFYSIVLLAGSKFVELPIFSSMKVVVLIGSFSFIVFGTLLLALFVIVKAASKVIGPAKTVMKMVA